MLDPDLVDPDPPRPVRVLFVFAWLVVGGEETEVRLLARHLDPARYRVEVIACFRKDGMPDQTHRQLAALGIAVDTTAYDLSFEDTVAYLARKLPGYDVVVSCQNVADIYPALDRSSQGPRIDVPGINPASVDPAALALRQSEIR